jgi:hypothetical protein
MTKLTIEPGHLQTSQARTHKLGIMQQFPGTRLSPVISVFYGPVTISNMHRLYAYFFRGLISFLPVGLTVYVLYLFITWVEASAMRLLSPITGDFYLPGLGIVLGTGLGALVKEILVEFVLFQRLATGKVWILPQCLTHHLPK